MERKHRVVLHVLIGLLWLATGSALSTRIQLVFDYSTLPLVPPAYEVLAVSVEALAVLAVPMLLFLARVWYGRAAEKPAGWRSEFSFVMACLPLLFLAARCVSNATPERGWWEPIWFAVWTGVGIRMAWAAISVTSSQHCTNSRHGWIAWILLIALTVGCGSWWFLQSSNLFADFQLGFNDFAHFSQRISSTAKGDGFLLESPVLPPFWDHFNPGLVLLVPLWMLWPSVTAIFALQALCLAGSGLLIAAVAKAKGQPDWVACVWGAAWLLFPVVGQMNLAYTYGWHPISLAIPCLLASYGCMVVRRFGAAIAMAVLATSFEEGVFVAIGCFAVAMAIRAYANGRTRDLSNRQQHEIDPLGAKAWCAVALVAIVGFIVVYRWSGLAEFQTGRFARLGGGPFEIVLSPFLRPATFWSLLLRERNLPFVCFLLAPLIAGASKPWLWYLLAVLPPLAVLMVWEHMPAQSIAFQYTSCLLPILFVGAMRKPKPATLSAVTSGDLGPGAAMGVFVSSWCLSLFVGQMPWSVDSLVDVKAKSYGIQATSTRSIGSDANRWLSSRIARIREGTWQGDSTPSRPLGTLRMLATGRIAAHFVGAKEIETVGQFWQRYSTLQALDPQFASPATRYDLIVLDHMESFQQLPEETRRLQDEALRAGFVVIESGFGVEVLIKTKRDTSP